MNFKKILAGAFSMAVLSSCSPSAEKVAAVDATAKETIEQLGFVFKFKPTQLPSPYHNLCTDTKRLERMGLYIVTSKADTAKTFVVQFEMGKGITKIKPALISQQTVVSVNP